MAAVQGDPSVAVGRARRPLDDVEGLFRERQKMRLANLGEGGPAEPLLAVELPFGMGVKRLGKPSVVVLKVVHLGRGREEVPPGVADLALDVSLPLAGVRVAEAGREAVVQPEPAEEAGLHDHVAPPPPGPGGVVEHDDGGNAPDVLEAVLEPLADTDVLPVREGLAHLVVGVREGHRQVVHPCPAAAEGMIEAGLPEVDLHGARVPSEPHRLAPRPLGANLLHVALHRGVAATKAMLRAQPLEDALGRVALLVVAVAALPEHLADEGLVGIELARVLRGLGPLGREVVFLSVLPDRWVRHSEGPLHLRRRIAIREHVAYPLYLGHVQHLPFLPLDPWVGPCESSMAMCAVPGRVPLAYL